VDPGAPIRAALVLALPRSGSTLLQRLLASHPDVATTPEPWLALAPIFALRTHGHAAYGQRTAARAVNEFCTRLPGGQGQYLRETGRWLQRLYAAAAGGRPVFVDKTPRHYLIATQLAQALPDARFVVLTRHPLAMVASIARTWKRGRLRLGSNAQDVFEGPGALAAFLRGTGVAVHALRYEDLVADPQARLAALGAFLGLADVPAWAQRAQAAPLEGPVGDPTGLSAYGTRVSPASAARWRDFWDSPLRRRFARRYLETLGQDTLRTLGYADIAPPACRGGAHHILRDLRELRTAVPALVLPGERRFRRLGGWDGARSGQPRYGLRRA
jgi:LPS sulfotransferase NodH